MTDHNIDTLDALCECLHKRSRHATTNDIGSQHCEPCSDRGIGDYCKQFRERTVATCGAVRHYSFCMPGRPCDKNSRPTEFETVESVYQELHRQGYTLSRQAVKQIVKTIQENKLALDFLGRM